MRPDWVERWVDKPQRFLPYVSLMPPYFSTKEAKWQNAHAGIAQDQIQAVRDALANYPRISELPVNRFYNPDLVIEKKSP